MRKQDYIAIAKVLDANRAPVALVQDMADTFEEGNPRFNRALFVQASTNNLMVDMAHDKRLLDSARQGR
jgi:hypothetical protein